MPEIGGIAGNVHGFGIFIREHKPAILWSTTPDFFEKSEVSKLILGNYIAVVSLISIFPIKCRQVILKRYDRGNISLSIYLNCINLILFLKFYIVKIVWKYKILNSQHAYIDLCSCQ